MQIVVAIGAIVTSIVGAVMAVLAYLKSRDAQRQSCDNADTLDQHAQAINNLSPAKVPGPSPGVLPLVRTRKRK